MYHKEEPKMNHITSHGSKFNNPFKKKPAASKQPMKLQQQQQVIKMQMIEEMSDGGITNKQLEDHTIESSLETPACAMRNNHNRKSSAHNSSCIIGYRGTYLGFVPSFESGGNDCIYYCVEKILDGCNAREALMRDSFVDIQTSCMKVYFVNDYLKVIETKIYDLARISYCCSNHDNDPRIFSWIYRQEIDIGFQSECHAVRFSSEKKASLVAAQLYQSFNKMYSQVETAVTSSTSSMLTKFKAKLNLHSDSDSSPSSSPKHLAMSSKYSSPAKKIAKMAESGSFADNMGFENLEEHCIGIEYESDNVFAES